jgi:hypothetical protein
MIGMEYVKDIAQVVYYLSLSVSGPLALIGYLRSIRAERREREYRAYDELDNKFLEYQKLALEHDLDLIDLPDCSPFLAGDRLRKKHELVTATCGFALFQRAYLMFHDQSDAFKARQWAGWERLLTAFVARWSVRDAWQVSRHHFDRRFQAFVDDRIAAGLEQAGVEPAVIHAFRSTGLLVRDENEHTLAEEELASWRAALQEHARKKAA